MKVLDDPKRRSIRQRLAPVIGDEDAENLVSALPSEDDDIVTKQFFKAELSEFRVSLADTFATKEFLNAEFAKLPEKLADTFATKEFLNAEFAKLPEKLEEKFATKDFLRAELADGLKKQTVMMFRAILLAIPFGMGVAGGVAGVVTKVVG